MNDHLLSVAPSPEAFSHIRTIMGIVLGLCVSRLLTGTARFIQHPKKLTLYPTHLIWVGFMLFSVARFWWFEFDLRGLSVWTFKEYLFVIFYSSLYFLLCTLLYPDSMEEYTGYRDYFLSRRHWFFGLLIILYLTDLIDTLLKGGDHLVRLGIEYKVQTALIVSICVVAFATRNQRWHGVLAVLALVSLVVFTLRHYAVLF